MQPIADGVKLFLKEDITPSAVDRLIYFIAPALALFPAFAIAGTVPWGPLRWLTPVADVNIGVLYILAISSLGVYGIVLGGYAANNKYSLMGGLRSSAQLISYELSMGMALAAVVLATGSLKPTAIVTEQEGPLWGLIPFVQNWFVFTPFGFVSFVIFAICMIAETNRAPFDLPEAENELIAGYHTEYSSMKFAVYFMGEYAAMFIFGGIAATIFLGGWHAVPIRWDWLAQNYPSVGWLWGGLQSLDFWLAPLLFLGKCALGITGYIWLRATLPRLRYDQLMSLGWKGLLPIGTANFIVVALWIVVNRLYGAFAGWGAVIAAAVMFTLLWKLLFKGDPKKSWEKREVELVDIGRQKIEVVDPSAGVA